MKFLDYTTVKGFLPQIKCRELREVVAALVETLQAEGVVQDGESLTREVLRREAADSTAIGAGLVLPHARCRDLKSVHLAVATLAEPLDLEAPDGRPVDVVIMLVGPQGDPREMLRVLARLARLVKGDSFLDDLRVAADGPAMRQLFLDA